MSRRHSDQRRETRVDLVWLAEPVTVPRTSIRVVGYDAASGLPEWIAEASEAIGDDDRAL